MTCVVALRTDDGKIYLGGDSFCGSEDKLDLCVEPKVYMVGPVGVGICGHIRQELILRATLQAEIEEKKVITEEWIKHDLAEAVRSAMRESGTSREQEGMSLHDSAYLLAHDGVIYYFDSDFGIWISRREYSAIGCGKYYALGSLHTSVRHNRHNDCPEQAVLDALEASATLSPFVAGPMLVIPVEAAGA